MKEKGKSRANQCLPCKIVEMKASEVWLSISGRPSQEKKSEQIKAQVSS